MKAQIWYLDFILGLVIFTMALTIAIRFVTGRYMVESQDIDAFLQASKAATESLMGTGIPEDWTTSDVVRIGITDGDYLLDIDKLENFYVYTQQNYPRSKLFLGSIFDYMIFFRNRDDQVIPLIGSCAVGNGYVPFNTSTLRLAYYYNGENFMRSNMSDLGADIYNKDGSGADGDIQDFFNNISEYNALLLESPKLDDVAPLTESQVKAELNAFASEGGFVILADEVNVDLGNATYVSSGDTNEAAAVINPESYFNLSGTIDFYETHYFNATALTQNFKIIASSGKYLVTRWDYGLGRFYHFSDLDNSLGDDILEKVKKGMIASGSTLCEEPSISGYDDLIPTPRYVIYAYNGTAQIVSMVMYLWD